MHKIGGVKKRKSLQGFLLIELLVVIGIIAILTSTVLSNTRIAREKAYFVRGQEEFRAIETALSLYLGDNAVYPADASRNVPPGLETYLRGGVWPPAAWPGSFYDWENWDDPDTGEKIYQISIRFCPLGQPEKCRFPTQSWAKDFDISSGVYYCLKGACRADINEPFNHPGYCINCESQPSG